MSSSTVSGAPSSTLRLAIFVPAGPVPAWVMRLVGDCASLPDVALVALLRDEGTPPAAVQADGEPPRRVALTAPPGVAEWSGSDAGEAARWLAGQAPEVLLDLRLEPALLPEGPARHWTLAQADRTAEDDAAVALVAVPDSTPVEGARDTRYGASTQTNPRRDIARGMGMVRRALLHLAQSAHHDAGDALDA